MSMKKKGAGIVCAVSVIIGIVTTQYSDEIRTGKDGLEIIGNAESCRRDPYMCPAGVLTDGIGNTHGVEPKKILTDQEIARDWVDNIKKAEWCVNKYANGEKLRQGPFEAATSIVFNAGCGNMKESTMFRQFRAGKVNQACEQFPRWVYAGGVKLKGLENRRIKERQLCLK